VATASEEIALLRGTKPATFKNLLRDPGFSRLYRAILVSSLGDWVGFVAVVALVTRIGGAGGGFAVSGVMLARLLPSVVFGPFAGVLVDRFDRKKLMFISDVVRGVGYATLPLIPHLPWIYAMSFVIECLSLLWTPARDAIIPNLVPRRQLGNANTIALATGYGTLPLGGIIYTALAALAGSGLGAGLDYFAENPESLALWGNGLSFAFSAFMISGLPLRAAARRGKGGKLGAGNAVADMREGVRFLKDHVFARAMTVGVVLAFTGAGAVMSVGPIFAAQLTNGDPAAWGLLVTAVGVGLGIGMALAGQVHKWIEKDTYFPLALLAGAAALIVMALTPNIVTASLVVVVMGAAAGSTWVTGYTLLQENVGDELRGRVFATLTVLSRLGLFVSLAGFPLLAQLLPDFTVFGAAIQGTRQAIVAGAVIMVAGGVFARRGLARSRLTRPRPLRLMPRLRKTEKRGTFIAFEGVEGAGKGTQIRLAREFLEGLDYNVLVTREPGGTALGERLRASLLDDGSESVDARAEALLFAASRAQHVSRVIRPALEEGKVVLCDRYMDSSLAYQGAARGLGEQDVLSLNVWATQGLFPDLVVLLNLDPDKRRDRIQEVPDRIESEDDAFHNKVAEAFIRIAEDHPERFVVIDGDAPPEVVHERVKAELLKYLKAGDQEQERA
jgi:dTMP kinase